MCHQLTVCGFENVIYELVIDTFRFIDHKALEHQTHTCDMTNYKTSSPLWGLRAATDENQKTLNKCETRNKTVFDTRLRHPETINSVPLNSVLRIKQTCV